MCQKQDFYLENAEVRELIELPFSIFISLLSWWQTLSHWLQNMLCYMQFVAMSYLQSFSLSAKC